jgi:NADPH2:quinone reductase
MTVVQFGGTDQLELRTTEAPTPAADEVSIDVDYAAVGLLDVIVRRGELPGLVHPPFVPGLEVAGRIRELGASVSGLEVGQSVVTLSRPTGGGYSDVALSTAALAIPLNSHPAIDPAIAVAMLPNLVTAVGALTHALSLRGGESVLVHGAGGGLASAFPAVARSLSASRIVGAVSSEKKIAAALAFGFDDVVLTGDLQRTAEKFDVIVDPVGGPVRQLSLGLIKPMGRLLAVGNASGAPDPSISANDLWLGNTGVVGFNVGGLLTVQPHLARELAVSALNLLAGGAVNVPVKILALAQAGEAHSLLESRDITGKIVLKVDH